MDANRENKSFHSEKQEGQVEQFVPPPVIRMEDTGLSGLWLQDLTLKILYYQGYLTGFKIAEQLSLPFTGVVDQILEMMKREKLVEIKTAQQMGLGEGTYVTASRTWASTAPGKPWSAASMPVRRRCRWKTTAYPSWRRAASG